MIKVVKTFIIGLNHESWYPMFEIAQREGSRYLKRSCSSFIVGLFLMKAFAIILTSSLLRPKLRILSKVFVI